MWRGGVDVSQGRNDVIVVIETLGNPLNSGVAQLVLECWPVTPEVAGSSPVITANKKITKTYRFMTLPGVIHGIRCE